MRWILAFAITLRASGLLDAVKADDRAAAERLLQSGEDANSRDDDGTTPLLWAAVRSNAEMTSILLEKGADPNLTNELGIGPLAMAITGGATGIAGMLLERGADPNAARENGETPLMIAARMGRVDLMQRLLAKGANANARESKFQQTALMWAAGHPEAVQMLLKHGADVHAATKAWDVKYTNYLPTTVTLGKTGIPWNNAGDYVAKKGGLRALHFAVQKNSVESVRALLDAGAQVNTPSADGTTPLLTALYKWDPPNVTFVPGRGAPATAGSSQQFRPNLRIAQLLLERGASVKVADGTGYTPLHGAALAVAKAARTGNRQKGAYGQTAAALALGDDDDTTPRLPEALDLVRRLLEMGADPNRATIFPTGGPAGDVRINPAPAGSSAMHIAASSGSVDLLKLLAGRGGDANQLRKDGHTPLSVSVLAGDLAMVREMVAAGANALARWSPQDKIPDPVEAITLARQDQTVLHLAAIEGKPELLTYLHSLGAPLDARNAQGETPLDLADRQERYREAILRQGAEGDPERLKKVVRKTAGSDCLRQLAEAAGRQAAR
ncbi:MAG: hypothetical protein FJW30_28325 [Acidobacteria bacterium]|nr:hypothetical protein [Acidobacteriota bacterium]